MKKKLLSILILGIIVLGLTGCGNKNEEKVELTQAMIFKETYESLNNRTNTSGKEHRTLNISEDNPFIYATGEDIVEKIEKGETFYVYFGDKLCPWCRSAIEKAIEIANKHDVKTIYYVPIWDDVGNEVLRDKYEIENDKVLKVHEGTQAYYKLLDYLKDYISDYEFAANKNGGDKLGVNEKRIYAPTFIYIKDGETIKSTSGLSDEQKDAREKLTDKMLEDEEKLFEEFFDN